MTTLDTLRAALFADDPYEGIDRLVRAELAAGRRTKQVYDALLALVVPVRETPGYTDETDDVLMDTLDALSGYVHPDCQYKDPEPPAAPSIDGPAEHHPPTHTPG